MSAPRWYSILSETLVADKNPAYTLSTILSTPSGTFPRSRSVIHRGIISPTPSHPLLLTTTDIRTPKAHQLHANPNSEATFWFAGPQVQFRIVSSTHLLPTPAHAWHASFPGRELAGGVQFDWDREREDAFDGISGHLRASFLRPVPGTPMGSYDEAEKWPVTVSKRRETEGGEDRGLVDGALANFALVVLDPTEVEFIELAIIPNRRTKWRKKGDQWEEIILVP